MEKLIEKIFNRIEKLDDSGDGDLIPVYLVSIAIIILMAIIAACWLAGWLGFSISVAATAYGVIQYIKYGNDNNEF